MAKRQWKKPTLRIRGYETKDVLTGSDSFTADNFEDEWWKDDVIVTQEQ